MNIGAIITVAGEGRLENSGSPSTPRIFSGTFGGCPLACCEILGQTLLERTLANLRAFGIQQEAVLFEESPATNFLPCRVGPAGAFFTSWEAAVDQQLQRGAEELLLIRLGAYLEMNFLEFLRFHRETASALTQVYDDKTAFEVAIVSAKQLQGKRYDNDGGSYRARLGALIPYHRRFSFRGYSNRLKYPQDFRQLVRDSLFRRTLLHPLGDEVRENVWMGRGAEVDSTSQVFGPAYFGAGTCVNRGCTIKGATSIEGNCKVDFGTTVSDSCVLPGTYVGMGLNVASSIVAPGKVFHLRRNVEVEVFDRKLVGSRQSLRSRLGLAKPLAGNGFLSDARMKLTAPNSHL